ncbi:hypothetical protein GCM10009767_13620 [Kocuria aegyptia]|uniref:Uncharacterized protein n=1 Tax=Kocuria aegyptia TaxID=330943 RepID=A0ABN2KGD1_9MICC
MPEEIHESRHLDIPLIRSVTRKPGAVPICESVMRSRLISNSIWARAAMTVKTIEPIGVAVSTSPPPGSTTRNPAPLSLSASAKARMFRLDRRCPHRNPYCNVVLMEIGR